MEAFSLPILPTCPRPSVVCGRPSGLPGSKTGQMMVRLISSRISVRPSRMPSRCTQGIRTVLFPRLIREETWLPRTAPTISQTIRRSGKTKVALLIVPTPPTTTATVSTRLVVVSTLWLVRSDIGTRCLLTIILGMDRNYYQDLELPPPQCRWYRRIERTPRPDQMAQGHYHHRWRLL